MARFGNCELCERDLSRSKCNDVTCKQFERPAAPSQVSVLLQLPLDTTILVNSSNVIVMRTGTGNHTPSLEAHQGTPSSIAIAMAAALRRVNL
jgi:hypothetical protein